MSVAVELEPVWGDSLDQPNGRPTEEEVFAFVRYIEHHKPHSNTL